MELRDGVMVGLGWEVGVGVGGLGVSLDDGWLEERGKLLGGEDFFLLC